MIPWRRNVFISIAIFLFLLLHIGIWTTLYLGSFPPACIILWLALIPAPWWNKASVLIEKIKLTQKIQEKILAVADRASTSDIRLNITSATKSFGVFFILVTFAWNFEGAKIVPGFHLGSPIDEVVFLLQWNQQWNMFAPKPMRNDGWFIAEGHLKDGSTWNILNDSIYTEARPDSIADTYSSSQWRKFMTHIYGDNNQIYRLWLGKFLCRKWNSTEHAGKEILNYKLFFMRELTAPLGKPANPIQKQLIWTHNCF
jgi:hypothetical protein